MPTYIFHTAQIHTDILTAGIEGVRGVAKTPLQLHAAQMYIHVYVFSFNSSMTCADKCYSLYNATCYSYLQQNRYYCNTRHNSQY